jgi:3-hydroxypropanoate dehydrogenase
MGKPLPDASLDQLWRLARTRRQWRYDEVPEVLIRAVYDLQRWAPTSGNICPGRFLFVHSKPAKDRLDKLMDEGNRKQTYEAPWTCIVAYDLDFHRHMDVLAPHMKDPAKTFADEKNREWLAIQNGSLGGAYLIMAIRALGLDAGPMNGFDREGINREFFLDDPKMKSWRVNFVCNIGYADPDEKLRPRAGRLDFDIAAGII